jgi:hypothetical protein
MPSAPCHSRAGGNPVGGPCSVMAVCHAGLDPASIFRTPMESNPTSPGRSPGFRSPPHTVIPSAGPKARSRGIYLVTFSRLSPSSRPKRVEGEHSGGIYPLYPLINDGAHRTGTVPTCRDDLLCTGDACVACNTRGEMGKTVVTRDWPSVGGETRDIGLKTRF